MGGRPTSRREFIRNLTVAGGLLAAGGVGAYVHFSGTGRTPEHTETAGANRRLKLYWFIPDGLRCEPDTFRMYEWARQGLLPNIRKLMQTGTYGYSVPVFPGHTPTNFATLLTGTTPRTHGVADGPMRIEGYPLKMVSKGGFSSVAKKVPPIWYTLEKDDVVSALLSIPGSTPPELNLGLTIKGRWGGWGLDFPATNFHSAHDRRLRVHQGFGNRVFYFGPELTRFIESEDPSGWEMETPASRLPPREMRIVNWGQTIYGYIYASADAPEGAYDRVIFSLDKRGVLADLKAGQWSRWCPVRLTWETKNDYNIFTPKRMSWEREISTVTVDTEMKLKVIRLGEKDFFRVRVLYNNLNKYLVRPPDFADELTAAAGPMVDFVDSYPPQLIYLDEDKQTFLEEARLSIDWHRRAVGCLTDRSGCDVILHSIYTPNQMLTSRWWLGYVDPDSPRYGQVSDTERAALWDEVKTMYQGIDAIVGEILRRAEPDSTIVVSSDHGAVPLFREVRLNNLFARRGWLKFSLNARTGEYEIDWERTRVVFLKMDNVYINPEGLGGNYRRAAGAAYQRLRAEVRQALTDLRDDRGICPLEQALDWEQADRLDLPADRVGDLIVANRPHYGWIEHISPDLEVFHEAVKSGYKQAIVPQGKPAMWTPFLIAGPGVKAGHRLAEPIRHIDQYPTVMKLLGRSSPSFVEGRPLDELFTS